MQQRLLQVARSVMHIGSHRVELHYLTVVYVLISCREFLWMRCALLFFYSPTNWKRIIAPTAAISRLKAKKTQLLCHGKAMASAFNARGREAGMLGVAWCVLWTTNGWLFALFWLLSLDVPNLVIIFFLLSPFVAVLSPSAARFLGNQSSKLKWKT